MKGDDPSALANMALIHGVGIGRARNGKGLCVKVYVRRRSAIARVKRHPDVARVLRHSQVDFERAPLPGIITARKHGASRAFHDPVIGGISVGHRNLTAGTIGYFCFETGSNEPLLLSCAHVLAPKGAAVGDEIIQPGRLDRGGNVIGRLAKVSRSVDAATALLSVTHSVEVLHIGKVEGNSPAEISMCVKKTGRTTGLTFGEVDAVSLAQEVLDPDTGEIRKYRGLVRIAARRSTRRFLDGGDSGSLVVTDDGKRAVGLLFAGNETGTAGYIHPIELVEKELGISLA